MPQTHSKLINPCLVCVNKRALHFKNARLFYLEIFTSNKNLYYFLKLLKLTSKKLFCISPLLKDISYKSL